MAAAQSVVPVPTNVVVTQQPAYTHTDIEELSAITIPVPQEDPEQPPAKKGRESTGKWKGYDSKRVFKKEWEDRYAWVTAVPEDPTLAYCKICGKKIRAHKGDIEKHQKTKRHLKKQTTSDILADLIPISCADGGWKAWPENPAENRQHSAYRGADDGWKACPGSPMENKQHTYYREAGDGWKICPGSPAKNKQHYDYREGDAAEGYQATYLETRDNENLDGTKNNDVESNSDARVVAPAAQVADGQQEIIYFTESAVDSAHQAANSVIDKLVEKYHQRRLDNLKIEHEAILQLYKDQLLLSQRETQSKVDADSEKAQFERVEHEARLRFMQEEHTARLKAIEEEHSAKLRAIEQEVMFAQQEYEKKMRLLDVQLSSMK
ncbi:uncharacterized protein LOC118202966 isoform X2 [Stegodyphus dumicola]|uniref:uncharacterized protein LOC118202966 isoform X2 n=1 Tax=Stegodyphus dumicola TaxID=202533 RepID=UPI0015AA438A|nr:uncharacterized protein LOC118202966 isoform X2 [Stegodyphus dumicola]